ncbi:UNVERIFIED_CONTAM: hypothetical protein HDU68_007278 [Siphonaria sp. JEL0065]|nr:hypothetical protein HDU68_007278 [Siphonaria sp. JEL0065]
MASPIEQQQQQPPQQQQQQFPPMTPHDVVASHLYHYGFVQGLHSDLLVRVPLGDNSEGETVFKLHRLLAVRSPFLSALIVDAEQRSNAHPLELVLPATDSHVTSEGLSIALGSLYADYAGQFIANGLSTAATATERARLLKSVLAAACLLHLPALANLAADLIKQDINITSLPDYCAFVSLHLGTTDKDVAVLQQQQQQQPSSTWILEIRDAIFAFLCKGIVREICERRATLIWGNKGSDAYKELVLAFSELPFEWLKKVVEGKDFEVPNDMERFAFAKEVVAIRAKKQRSSKSNLVTGEENVLLAFGGGKAGASGVTLVRKAPKLVLTPQLQQQQQFMQKQQLQYQQQQQQYLQQQQQQQQQQHLHYSVIDQYTDLQAQQQAAAAAQQLYHQNLAAQGYNGIVPPQERRVWKAGN